MFSYLFSKTVTSTIPSEAINNIVKNTNTYAGIKVSDTTYNYFANATGHFANATKAAVNCTSHASQAVWNVAQIAGDAFWGLSAFRLATTEVMTGLAFNYAMPAAAKTVISGLAGLIYNHAPIVLGACVGFSIASNYENALKLVENTAYTVKDAANLAYYTTACGLNLAAGAGHFVYDNLPSSSQVDLAGSMEVVSWVDAVA